MKLSQTLNIIGLILDIMGVIILFHFGLPADVNRHGTTFIISEQIDKEEKAKGKKYNRLSYIALALLILGFLFQICASYTSVATTFNLKPSDKSNYNHTNK